MNLASIVFTSEELLALAQATQTFSTLLEKIKTAAPDAWAAAQSDFTSSLAAWNAVSGPAPLSIDAARAVPVNPEPAAPVDGGTIHNDASTDPYVQVQAIVQAGAEPRDQQI